MRKTLAIGMVFVLTAAVFAAVPTNAASIITFTNPDATYLAAASAKIDISGLSPGSSYGSITDGVQTVTFSSSMQKLGPVPSGWDIWSSPPYSETPNPHVLFTKRVNSLTLTLSVPTTVFGFELEPNIYSTYSFTADFYTGATLIGSITRSVASVAGEDGARLFAAQTQSTAFDKVDISVSGNPNGFAIAQVRYNPNLPPVADANGPYVGLEGSPINLDASGSYDPDDYIVSWEWDLDDDGLYDDATGQIVTHTWYDDYTGTIGLKVTDSFGATDTDDTTVTVNNVAPTASIDSVVPPFSVFILPGDVLEFYGSFTDPGTGDTHTIGWDFGDSTTVTGTLTPTHAYATAGTYTITLTVTDDDAGVGTDTTTVTVISAQDAVDEVNDDIQNLPNVAFKKPADNRKKALSNKLDAVKKKIDAGEYQKAIDKLQDDIKPKMDGDPNPEDWITDETAIEELCAKIDVLIAYLETLL